ncbi:MAG TPA: HAMP domain-containing sensor histidine kinase [Ktedonobacterales bacterium]
MGRGALVGQSAGTSARSAQPTIQAILAQCVMTTSLDYVVLAALRPRRGSQRLSVLGRYPYEEHPRRIPRTLSTLTRNVTDLTHPLLVVRRLASARGGGKGEALVAAPVLLPDQHMWGVLAGIGPFAGFRALTLDIMERAAREIAQVLFAGAPPTTTAAASGANGLIHQGERDARDVDAQLLAEAPHDVLVHQIRTPLSAADYALELLLRAKAPANIATADSEQARLLRVAWMGVAEAQRTLDWYGQLTSLGMTTPTITPVSAYEIVGRAAALLPEAATRIHLHIAADAPQVAADEFWLLHVLTNLLNNAVEHAPASSAIEILSQFLPPDHALISVLTTGAGIPPHEREAIFRPYMRGAAPDDPAHRGLGLSVARYFVTRMGGNIWAESDGATWTRFVVSLPLASHPVT